MMGPHCAPPPHWPTWCVALFEQTLVGNGEFSDGNGFKIQQIRATKLKNDMPLCRVWKGIWADVLEPLTLIWSVIVIIFKYETQCNVCFKGRVQRGSRKGAFTDLPLCIRCFSVLIILHPEYLLWSWFYNPYFVDEKTRPTPHCY